MSDKLESLNNVCIQLGVPKVSHIQSGRMSEFQGLRTEVNERIDSQEFWRCPLYSRCLLLKDVH